MKRGHFGLIPRDWKESQLSQVSFIEGGYAFSSRKFVGSGKYQVIKMSNLYGGKLDLTRSPSFLEHIDGIEMRYLLKKDDILLTLTGTTGKKDYGYSCRIKNEKNLLVNQRLARIVANQELDSSYLSYQLASPLFLDQFFEISKGGTGNQTNVGTGDISRMFVPVPPTRAEQEAIANALSDADAYIESLEKLIEKKRHIKKGAMQELLTGKRRLPGFSGEWNKVSVGAVASLKNGYAFKSTTYSPFGSYSVVTIANVQSGFMDLSDCSRTDFLPSDLQEHQKIAVGDILVSMTGNVGRVCRASEERCLLNQRVGKIQAKSIDTEFIYSVLSHDSFLASMISNAKGGAQPNLSSSDILEYSFLCPPNQDEQREIASALRAMADDLVLLQSKLFKARLIKQGMMQELLTGRIRLV